jgi:hypothetical protein
VSEYQAVNSPVIVFLQAFFHRESSQRRRKQENVFQKSLWIVQAKVFFHRESSQRRRKQENVFQKSLWIVQAKVFLKTSSSGCQFSVATHKRCKSALYKLL